MASDHRKKSRWMSSLKPFVGFGICLAAAFFKTGTKVVVKHLNAVSPVLISCIQYLVIGLLAQPIAACRSHQESPFPRGINCSQFLCPCFLFLTNVVRFAYCEIAISKLPYLASTFFRETKPIDPQINHGCLWKHDHLLCSSGGFCLKYHAYAVKKFQVLLQAFTHSRCHHDFCHFTNVYRLFCSTVHQGTDIQS